MMLLKDMLVVVVVMILTMLPIWFSFHNENRAYKKARQQKNTPMLKR
ncbi:hypothetical protein [Liquorilactobacillus uvarum]|nr:hypothetical protein [Liquorilactobacillus uvarum]